MGGETSTMNKKTQNQLEIHMRNKEFLKKKRNGRGTEEEDKSAIIRIV